MLVLMAVDGGGMLLAFYLPLFQAISAVQGRGPMSGTRAPPTRAGRCAAAGGGGGARAGRPLRARVRGRRLLRARPRDPAVGPGRADVPLQLPALPARGRPAGAGDGRPHRHPGGGRAEPAAADARSSPRWARPSAIQEALKRGQGTQRVLEQASRVLQDPDRPRATRTATRSCRSTRSRPTSRRSSGSSTRRSSTRSTAAPPTSTSRRATARW